MPILSYTMRQISWNSRGGNVRDSFSCPACSPLTERSHGQCQCDEKSWALAICRLSLDAPAQLLDVAPHNVHANAAARYVSDFFCSRESWLENQLVDLPVRELTPRGDHPVLGCFRQDLIL